MHASSRRLSRYLTLARLIHSDTAKARGIDNHPPPELIENLRMLARGLDSVRRLLGHPLEISSGYRSPALNAAVGGTPGSQHTLGLAADFICPRFGEPMTVAHAIVTSEVGFDQCILEFGRWVHLSFSHEPRRRALTIYDSRAGYLEGLVPRDVIEPATRD
jgi:zinc D-Ala-D-Ala carboxypeptidase